MVRGLFGGDQILNPQKETTLFLSFELFVHRVFKMEPPPDSKARSGRPVLSASYF